MLLAFEVDLLNVTRSIQCKIFTDTYVFRFKLTNLCKTLAEFIFLFLRNLTTKRKNYLGELGIRE